MASFLAPLLRAHTERHVLQNVRTNLIIAGDLLTAFDSASRRKGLLGRNRLTEGTAMIIAPSNAVHTFFMQFPIDIAFVSRQGRVLKIRAAAPARRVIVSLRAYAVIEMAAGALTRSDTQPGDMLVVVPSPQ